MRTLVALSLVLGVLGSAMQFAEAAPSKEPAKCKTHKKCAKAASKHKSDVGAKPKPDSTTK